MKRLYALEILSKFYLPEKSLKVDENQFHKHALCKYWTYQISIIHDRIHIKTHLSCIQSLCDDPPNRLSQPSRHIFGVSSHFI